MVLQESLQNLQFDPLPQPRPLTAHSPDEAASESRSGDCNCRENLQGKHLESPLEPVLHPAESTAWNRGRRFSERLRAADAA